MSASTQDLKFRILGEDAGASSTFGKVSKGSSDTHAALSKLSSQLSSMGGPFGVAQEAFEGIAGGLEHIKEHGRTVGAVLTGVGVAATGAGVLLTQFGAKDEQAQAQLQASVKETGNSWGDFKDKVEEAISTEEHYGHTADDTQSALNNLTAALQDPNKALAEMSVVADLAAKKHESLAQASSDLVRVQSGSTRALREFGITLDGNGTKTEQLNRALNEMSQRLTGQASSAADTFSGKLQAWKAHAEDVVSSMAKYAPILTALGPLATGAGVAMSYLAKQKAANAAADLALIPEETALAGAETKVALSAAAARQGLGAGALLGLGGTVGVALLGADLAHNYTTGQNAKSQAGLTALATSGAAGLAQVEQGRAAAAAGAGKAGFGDVGKKLLEQYDAAIKAAKGGEKAAASLTAIGQAAVKTKAALETEIASLHKHTDAALQASGTADAFQKSLNDLKDSADKNSKTLRGTSDAAIQNRDALRNLAQAELAHIDALQQQGASSATVRAKSIEMSRQLEAQATAVFGNKHQVDRLLGSLHLLPSQIKTEIKLDPADRAKRTLAALQAQIDKLTGQEHQVNIDLVAHGSSALTHKVGFSHGGLVTGGVPGRDSVPALLMPGEFVVRADRSNLGDIARGGGGGAMPAASGGGATMHVTIQAGVLTRDGAREIDKVLRQLNRETGGALGIA